MATDREAVNLHFTANASPIDSAIKKVVSALGTFGAKLAATSALLGFFAFKAVQPAIDEAQKFEVQVAELAKLMDDFSAGGVAEEIAQLGNVMPVARDQLFNVAETAARLGIRGTNNIVEFTETMAMMGVATDISAERAADAMARIALQTHTPINQLDNLGSAINELSNTMATSTSEIVENMRRASPALARLGLSAGEIAALGASLNEVSESSSRAGTRLRRLGQALANPDKVDDFAAALGKSTAEFQKMLKQNPRETILDLVFAFRDNERAAAILARTMDSRVRQVLAALAQQADRTADALNRQEEASKANVSLRKEYERFAETTQSKSQLVQNNIDDMQRRVGEDMLILREKFLEVKLSWLSLANTILNNPLEPRMGEGAVDELDEDLNRIFGKFMSGAAFRAPTGTAFGGFQQLISAFIADGMDMSEKVVRDRLSEMLDDVIAFNETAGPLFVEAFSALAQGTPKGESVGDFLSGAKELATNVRILGPIFEQTGERAREARQAFRSAMLQLAFSGDVEAATDRMHQIAQEYGDLVRDLEDRDPPEIDLTPAFADVAGSVPDKVFDVFKEFSDFPAIVEDMRPKIKEIVGQIVDLEGRRIIAGEDTDEAAALEQKVSALKDALSRIPGSDQALEFLNSILASTDENVFAVAEWKLELARVARQWEQNIEKAKEAKQEQDRINERFDQRVEKLKGEIEILRDMNEQGRIRQLLAEGFNRAQAERLHSLEKERDRLEEIKEKEEEREERLERLQEKIDKLTFATVEAKFDLLVNTIEDMADAFLDFAVDAIAGAESVGDALVQMIQRVVREIIESQLKGLLLELFSGVLSGLGGGIGGGGSTSTDSFASSLPFGRAKGGPVSASNLYVVGEEGPEFFIPDADGIVAPRLRKSGGGGGGQNTTIVNNITLDVQAMDARSFQQMLKTEGAGAITQVMLRATKQSERVRRGILTGQ